MEAKMKNVASMHIAAGAALLIILVLSQPTWVLAFGTFIAGYFLIQHMPNVDATENDFRDAHAHMAAIVLVFGNIVYVHFNLAGLTYLYIILSICSVCLLCLWLVPITSIRHCVLLWMMRSFLPMLVLCICLVDQGTFALYPAKEGKVVVFLKTLAMAISTLGFGFPFYSRQLCQAEFAFKMTLLTGVNAMSWIQKIDVWDIVVLNAVSHGASLIIFLALRFKTFSKECLYAILKDNVNSVVGVVMCLAIYCQLTSRMLLFAVFLCGCSAVVFLAHKKEHRQAPTERSDDSSSLHSRLAVDDEAIAIERFQKSYKPAVVGCIVVMMVHFVIAVLYPPTQTVRCCSTFAILVLITFRCYSVGRDNQGHVRWVSGWLCVAMIIFANTTLFFSSWLDLEPQHVPTGSRIFTILIGSVLLNIGGIPTACRRIVLLVDVAFTYLISSGKTPNESEFITAVGAAASLFGELIGRLSVRHGRVRAAEEVVASARFQSTFLPLLICSATLIFLELGLAIYDPSFMGRCTVCATFHVVTIGGRWYLRGAPDDASARWLFGWGCTIVSIGIMAVCTIALEPEQDANLQFNPGLIFGGASMLLAWFVYLNIIGTPWLSRWTMLCCMAVLVMCMPSFGPTVLLGAMVLGEVFGYLLVQSSRVNLSLLVRWYSLVIRWWCLAFEDEVTEREYVTKQFEGSYSTMVLCCVVLTVVWSVGVYNFPHDDALALGPLLFVLGVLGLRVHTELSVPSERKAAYFGFRLIVITLALIVTCAAVAVDRFAESNIHPAVIGCGAFCVVLLIVAAKLIHIPESHRHAINFMILTFSVVVSLFSKCNFANGIAPVGAAVLIGEVIAFTIDQNRRLSYEVAAGLRRELDSKAQMKLALDAIPMAACITDQNMNLVHVNHAALGMFGFTEKQLVGQQINILVEAPLDKVCEEFIQNKHKISSSIPSKSCEVQGKRRDGRKLDLELTLKTSADQTLFIASFCNLATEKEHLRRQRNMNLSLDTTLSPIAMTTSRLILTYINQAMCNIFGYSRAELIGKDIGIVMDETTREEHRTACETFQKTGQRDAVVVVGLEMQGKHKDGHTLDFRLSRNVTDDGKMFVMSFQDISAELAQRESLRQQQAFAFLRSLYARMPGTITYEVVNPGPDQSIDWVAGDTTSVLGCTHEEWQQMRQPLQTVLTDVSKPVATEAIMAIRKREPVQLTEMEGIHRDGHAVWLSMDKASCRLPSGNELMVLHDVTAEVRLREANAAVAIFQNLPGVILVTVTMDMSAHVAVDGDVFGVTGYTSDEFMTLDPLCDFLSPKADRGEVALLFQSIADSSQLFVEANLPYVHKDGHTIWLHACHGSRAVDSPTDGTANVLVVFSDVTARVLAQHEVQAVRDSLIRRMELVPAMVYEMVAEDPAGARRFSFVNAESKSIYGLTPDEMTSSCKWMDMLHPEDVELYETSMTTSQATMQKWDLEFRIVVDGETKYLHGRAAPHREGSDVIWTGVLQDVTVTHNLREMTKKRNIQKGIADQFKAACAYLSHEIRNQLFPQSVVLAEMKTNFSECTEDIDMMLSANKTINTILNKVLDVAKWDAGEFTTDMIPFPVSRLFKAIALYAKANGCIVEGDEVVEPTWHVKADEHVLKQAATNLVSNACKFSGGQPVSIAMSFEKISSEEAVIVVTVTDSGRGMTAEQLDKVMVPFGQIRKAGEMRSGTGLGLPLTKMMIEQGHNGTLTLASDGLGKGTTATIRVPVPLVARCDALRAESEPLWWVTPHPGATADVLVVDDVKMNRMIMTRAARKLGLTFHQAENGAQAVERLHKNTYSMVFMDRQMPGMNGDVAVEQARANGYTLPIVMVSGDTFDSSEKADLKQRGVTAIMSKMSVPGARHAMEKLQEMKNNAQNNAR